MGLLGGLLGGVPTPSPSTVKRPQSLQTTATTPGKVHVVENSGIHGKFICLLKALVCCLQYTCYFRDNPRCLSSLGSWRSDSHRKYLVRSRYLIFHKKMYILTISLPRFWFFAARNNPDTAPLALWCSGGVHSFHSELFLDYV